MPRSAVNWADLCIVARYAVGDFASIGASTDILKASKMQAANAAYSQAGPPGGQPGYVSVHSRTREKWSLTHATCSQVSSKTTKLTTP